MVYCLGMTWCISEENKITQTWIYFCITSKILERSTYIEQKSHLLCRVRSEWNLTGQWYLCSEFVLYNALSPTTLLRCCTSFSLSKRVFLLFFRKYVEPANAKLNWVSPTRTNGRRRAHHFQLPGQTTFQNSGYESPFLQIQTSWPNRCICSSYRRIQS